MTAFRISLLALLAFLAAPVAAQTPTDTAAPDGRDASFLPPSSVAPSNDTGQPIPLVTPPANPTPVANPPSNPSASAPPAVPPAPAPTPVPAPALTPPSAPAAAPPQKPADLGPPVESGALQNIDPDTIGLLAPEDGGLGAAMWKGTPHELVDRLLPAINLPNSSPALNALAQRFLLSIASIPQGPVSASTSLTAMRAVKLAVLGDAANAWKLAMLAKPDQLDDVSLRLVAEAALVSRERENVCKKLPEIIQAHNSPEWQKLLVVCQLRAGDTKAAQLGLEVLHSQNVKDGLFYELAEHDVIGGAKSLPRQLTPMKPLNLALLRLIDQPMPPEIYAHADASVTAELLQTKTREDGPRLALAERAASRGLLDSSQLAETYRSIIFTPEQLTGAARNSEKGSRQRALFYQAALTEQAPEKRLDLVSKFAQSLDAAPLNGAIARILAAMTGDVVPQPALIAQAPLILRILMMADKPKEALGWLKLLKSTPVASGPLQDLWPLAVLSGLETDGDYGQTFNAWLSAALKEADRGKREQIGNVLLLFDAAGFMVPEDAWAHVADLVAGGKRIVSPPALLLERLGAAGAANRRGEAVLLALALAGANENQAAFTPVIDTVRALRLTGLTADALALARETAAALAAASAAKP